MRCVNGLSMKELKLVALVRNTAQFQVGFGSQLNGIPHGFQEK